MTRVRACRCFGAIALAIFGFTAACPAQDGYGDLTGQFVLDGAVPEPAKIVKKGDPTVKDAPVCAADDLLSDEVVIDPETKGIANIFVYLTSKDAKKLTLPAALKESTVKEIEFDQKGCRFIPHALFVRADQTVVAKSSDAVAHNTHTYTVKNEAKNFLVAPNDRKGIPVTFTDAEIVPMPVKCDIHPWMQANWLILDHPYAAVTDKQGKFKIAGLPAGEYSFRVWHERQGYLNRDWKVTVRAGMTKMDPVKVPPSKLEKRDQ